MPRVILSTLTTVCVIVAIGYSVMTSDVEAGWFWPHVGYNLLWANSASRSRCC